MSSVSTSRGPSIEAPERDTAPSITPPGEPLDRIEQGEPRPPDGRRLALARAIVRELRSAIVDPEALEIVLDEEGAARRPTGDDQAAVDIAAGLARDAGFDPVPVGALARGKDFEPGTPTYNTGMSGREVRTLQDPSFSPLDL